MILYLDRLKQNGVHWGKRPRVKAWNDVEIRKACKADRPNDDGDFGCLGVSFLTFIHPSNLILELFIFKIVIAFLLKSHDYVIQVADSCFS